MRTRSSSNFPVESPPNPSTSNPKRRNHRRSKQPFILEESPVDTMADQRTMAELLRAPTEGYAEAIVVPPILAKQFELKHSLINMMTSDQFFGLEKDNPHDHIRCYSQTIQATPPPASVKAVEEICVTCDGAHPYYQCLAVDGKIFPELRDNIQAYVQQPQLITNRGELKAITTQIGVILDGPSVPIPPSFINLGEDEHVEETLMEQDLVEYTIKKMLKTLLSNKEKLLEIANTPLNENCSAVILKKLPKKLGDPGKFLIPCGFKGGNVLPEKLLDLDSTKDIHPPHHINPLSGSTTSSSSPNQLLEEFVDELTLITFPPGNDDLSFDIDNLEDLNDNLVDTMPEMFTDEHTLAYSSPPLYDEYDDDLFKVESDTKYVYDDPFDSKGEKIKESKLLIDELDLPSNFLSSSEYDSFLSEDFSKVDALPLTNNEDKKLAMSHASSILEDFDPPLYELIFFKEVPRSKTLLSFSFENEEKVFKLGIPTSKGVHSSLIPELSHRGYEVFKIN
uniref:Reverse transcriptase domain-containing protein n=1 Tax=Tanacetum cinerariifolium TaxID=118510 RepID=A0A6L2MAN8_TANCI|nr:reverse transcriptase domain-containing protein [Tanacetum cinerariifolium]